MSLFKPPNTNTTGSLDVSWKLPKDVERFYKEEVLVGEMKTIRAAYLCNVGVLSSARGCGVASSLLDFALSEVSNYKHYYRIITGYHRLRVFILILLVSFSCFDHRLGVKATLIIFLLTSTERRCCKATIYI